MAESRIALDFSVAQTIQPWNRAARKAGWLRSRYEDEWNIRFKFPAPTRGHEWKAAVVQRVLVKLDSGLSELLRNGVGQRIEIAEGKTSATEWKFFIYKPPLSDDHALFLRLMYPDDGIGTVPGINDIGDCVDSMIQVFDGIGWDYSPITLVSILGYHKLEDIMVQQPQADESLRRISFKRATESLRELKDSPAGACLEFYEADWFPDITLEEVFLRLCFLSEKSTGEVVFVQMITSVEQLYAKLAKHLIRIKQLGYSVVPGSFAICGCAYSTDNLHGMNNQTLKEKFYEDNLLWLLLMGKLTKIEYCIEANFYGILSLPCLNGPIDAEQLISDFATLFETHAGKSLILHFRHNALPDHLETKFYGLSKHINWANI